MKETNGGAISGDAGIVASGVVVLCLVSSFYYLEFYGAVLAAVYGAVAVDVFNRTSVGRRVREFLRHSRNE